MSPAARPSVAALVVAIVGAALLAAAAFCGDEKPAPPPPPAAYVPAPAEILLMLSGNEKGLLKPCGCSEPQRGGLERRAALLDSARRVAKAWAAVSLGETLWPWMPAQNQLKAELFRAALSAMGYQGMVLSAGDLSPLVPSLSQPLGGPAETPRPPLNVRVKRDGTAPASAGVDPVLRFEVGGLKVRVVSVVDPRSRDDLVASGVTDTVLAPEVALLALSKEPGLLVVAAHVFRESIHPVVEAARAASDLAIVVDVAGEVAYDRPVQGFAFEKPLLVTFEEKGKAVGLVRLAKAGSSWTASYEAVRLDPPFEEGSSTTRKEVQALFEAYKKRVSDEKLLEAYPRYDDGPASWVGSDACSKCHQAIYDSWKATPHASAYDILVAKGVSRDPECVHCHTVGWERLDREGQWMRRKSAFNTPEASPGLLHVGCESCHGAGSEHVKAPDRKDLFGDWRAAGKMWRDFGRQGCAQCHDIENSVPFQKGDAYQKDYRPVVDHRDVPADKRTVVPK